jgi:hypothetical protein
MTYRGGLPSDVDVAHLWPIGPRKGKLKLVLGKYFVTGTSTDTSTYNSKASLGNNIYVLYLYCPVLHTTEKLSMRVSVVCRASTCTSIGEKGSPPEIFQRGLSRAEDIAETSRHGDLRFPPFEKYKYCTV